MRITNDAWPVRRGAWTELAADELPTTLRRSPPPLPTLPRALPLSALTSHVRASQSPTHVPARVPRSKPPPLPRAKPISVREPLPSLASVLEPLPLLPFLRSRPALIPPDPRRFRPPRVGWRVELRWLVRLALLAFVIAGELALAAPSGALRRPRDVADAGAMISSAVHASVVVALAQ